MLFRICLFLGLIISTGPPTFCQNYISFDECQQFDFSFDGIVDIEDLLVCVSLLGDPCLVEPCLGDRNDVYNIDDLLLLIKFLGNECRAEYPNEIKSEAGYEFIAFSDEASDLQLLIETKNEFDKGVILIYNSHGRIVSQTDLAFSGPGQFRLSIQNQFWAPGFYAIAVILDGHRLTQSWIKYR